MPKLRKTDAEKQNAYLLGTISKQMYVLDISRFQIAACMGVKEKTYYNRLKKPENLSLGELRSIIHKLHIPKEDMLSALGYET